MLSKYDDLRKLGGTSDALRRAVKLSKVLSLSEDGVFVVIHSRRRPPPENSINPGGLREPAEREPVREEEQEKTAQEDGVAQSDEDEDNGPVAVSSPTTNLETEEKQEELVLAGGLRAPRPRNEAHQIIFSDLYCLDTTGNKAQLAEGYQATDVPVYTRKTTAIIGLDKPDKTTPKSEGRRDKANDNRAEKQWYGNAGTYS